MLLNFFTTNASRKHTWAADTASEDRGRTCVLKKTQVRPLSSSVFVKLVIDVHRFLC